MPLKVWLLKVGYIPRTGLRLILFQFLIFIVNFQNKKVRLVHISTPEVYGNTKNKVKEDQNFNPSTPYAVSRCTADTFLKILSKQKN